MAALLISIYLCIIHYVHLHIAENYIYIMDHKSLKLYKNVCYEIHS